MQIQRIFLGWKRAALTAAVDYVVQRYAAGKELDLSRVILVLPGQRAGRRMLELLVQRADELSLFLVPPQFVTEGRLPELLYEPQRPLATVLVQQLTWLRALQQMSPAALRPLVPHPPAANDPLRWLELAELFRKQHAEFAADALDFTAVLKRSAQWEDFAETARWETLCKLQRTYLDQLDELHLWDAQTARLVAIQHKEPKTDSEILLLGMVDMNTALRRMLDQVAERVTALIVAPKEEAARFDSHGCLIPEAWQSLPLPLSEDIMERVDGPAEQAAAVIVWLRSLNGEFAADEIVVGVADEALVPQLQREIAQHGLTARWVEGKNVAESAPFRLLEAATKYADRRRFADLAACVRHPDLYDWLKHRLKRRDEVRDLITTLDQFYQVRLSAWLDAADLAASDPEDAIAVGLNVLVKELEILFQSWPTLPQPASTWMQLALELLQTIYGDRLIDKTDNNDRYLLNCLESVRDALRALAGLPASLQPVLKLVDAIELAFAPLQAEAIAPPPDSQAVEILGWLELPLDDAPACIVTTVNEGFVPKSARTDAFLPDALRRDLGLLHDDRRCARDAYALQVLAHSRADLRLIAARRDTNNDPLAPSRLLFTGEPEVVAQRALRWFSPPPPAPPRPNLLLPRGTTPSVRSRLEIPRPQEADWKTRVAELLEKITVTQFKSYLACPYRFYLGHILKLRGTDDAAAELDPMAFGNLIHDVLQDFGREDDLKHSTDPRKLRHYFDDRLDAVAAERCRPRHARAAVRVQIEQARLRLRAFADWQALRTDAGWKIIYSETFDEQLLVPWTVDDVPIGLRGRIDRIDYHPGERTLAILDYKTGDSARDPDKVHRSRGEWVDLQLPLYRHLFRALSLPIGDVRADGVQLGYITLPKDSAGVHARMAGWSSDELSQADERARDVIRALRAGTFWPPSELPPAFEDEFSAICQDQALGRAIAQEGVE